MPAHGTNNDLGRKAMRNGEVPISVVVDANDLVDKLAKRVAAEHSVDRETEDKITLLNERGHGCSNLACAVHLLRQ